MSRLLVYIGPTLPVAEVRRLAPAAEVRPPVEGGTLGRSGLRRGDVMVLIDGYYRDRPAVRHKEILAALSAGVRVVGAASLGALRAAELAPHGMVGVGAIYQQYRSGEIWGDDEVAVKHSPAERGYRADSVALVNLRYGARLAVERGVIRAETATGLLTVAKALPFDERSWPRLIAAAEPRLDRPGQAELSLLEAFCQTREADLKAQDAALAITQAGRWQAPDGAAPAPAGPARWRTSYLRDWSTYWRSAQPGESGDWVSDLDVLDAARLYYEGYPALHHEVLSDLLGGLATASGVPEAQPMERYLAGLIGTSGDGALPAPFQRLLSASEQALPYVARATCALVRVWPINICRDWRPLVVARLREHPGWESWREIVHEADAARNGSRGRVPDEVSGLLFLRRWGVSGRAPVARELGRRGFLSLAGLDLVASRYASLELAGR